MNRKVTDCDIVLELLPLYIEEKSGKESNVFVESHLTECKACRRVHELMSADWMTAGNEHATDMSEVNAVTAGTVQITESGQWYRNKALWVIAGILAYAGLMAGLVIYVFIRLIGV